MIRTDQMMYFMKMAWLFVGIGLTHPRPIHWAKGGWIGLSPDKSVADG
jgi:hypothetical protein